MSDQAYLELWDLTKSYPSPKGARVANHRDIVLAGRELNGPGPDRGVVFQAPSLLPWMTAFENVMLGVDQVFYTAEARERELIAEYYLTLVWTWRINAQVSD